MFPWLSMTPLARPVVPDEKGRRASSSLDTGTESGTEGGVGDIAMS